MNASLISCIDKIISGDFSYLSEDDVLALKKNMILVDDDTNIYRSIKLQRLMSRLDTGYLTLTIAPTTACNFKCIYCYESGIAPLSAKAKLNLLEDTISFVKLFKNTKFLRVTWYGGEPLLQFEYIEKLSHRLMNLNSATL
ncbi:radical SAM protein [Segatella copri]|uniref:radical SAM protein n=1 Tax=Segatella copri TaxID=165179 RepID=UPI002FF1D203